jgi:hypothetical protein
MRQRPIAERMSELQQRIEALRQTKAQLEARQAAAERKRQERRRYLLGSFLLERLGREGPWREVVRAELSLFLKEERDRQLFAELLDGKRGNGEARAWEGSAEAVPAKSMAPTEEPDMRLEQQGDGMTRTSAAHSVPAVTEGAEVKPLP